MSIQNSGYNHEIEYGTFDFDREINVRIFKLHESFENTTYEICGKRSKQIENRFARWWGFK